VPVQAALVETGTGISLQQLRVARQTPAWMLATSVAGLQNTAAGGFGPPNDPSRPGPPAACRQVETSGTPWCRRHAGNPPTTAAPMLRCCSLQSQFLIEPFKAG